MTSVFAPHPALRPYIKSYQYAEIGEEDQWTMQSLAASPDPMMILVSETEHIDLKEDGQRRTYESTALLGSLTRCKETALKNKVNSLWITFRPCGISEVFGLHTGDYINQCVNLTDLMGSGIRNDRTQLIEQNEPDRIVEQVDRFLLRQLDRNQGTSDFRQLRYALEQLKAQYLKKNIISEVCRQVGYSLRSFERHTAQMTGLCPKQFQRIVRFNMALKSILKTTQSSWTQTAYEFGYTDQSHFIKEFKSFYGKTPGTISPDDGVMKHILHSNTATA